MKKGFWRKAAIVCLAALLLAGGLSPSVEAASKGYQFKKYGVTVSMHGKAASLIKKAGTPEKKKTQASCAYDGKDRTYQYKDFILYTYSKTNKGAEYVSQITFRTSKVSTKEGIKIGSTEEELLEAYSNAKLEYGVYVCEKGKSQLTFKVKDGKVTKIKYTAL
jgi:hypothetical protein